MRTTSSLEAYNGVLNKTIVNRGHFFNFIHDMRAEEFLKRAELNDIIMSGAGTAKRRRAEHKVSMNVCVIVQTCYFFFCFLNLFFLFLFLSFVLFFIPFVF